MAPSSSSARTKALAPTVVVFIRHGTTPTTGTVLPGRARGLHLADEGREQAKQTAAALASTFSVSSEGSSEGSAGRGRGGSSRPEVRSLRPRVTAVYSSPMERARETAKPIADELGLRVQVNRDLIECDFGEWTGEKLSDLAKLPEWKHLMADPATFRFPGGESLASLQARVLEAVHTLRQRHPGEVVVAVSHADPIKIALATALGSGIASIHRLWVSTASMSAVSYTSSGSSVLCVNAWRDLPPVVVGG